LLCRISTYHHPRYRAVIEKYGGGISSRVDTRHNEELRDIYASLILIGRNIKKAEISGASSTYMKINSYRFSTRKPAEKRSLV
jgi:hypothetical protein